MNVEKLPDLTVLYHLKGSGEPGATTVFRGPLGGSFSDSKDWHWAIVGARGIPPAAPTATVPQSLLTPPGASTDRVPPSEENLDPVDQLDSTASSLQTCAGRG